MAKQLSQSGFDRSQADVLQTEEPPADCSDMSDLSSDLLTTAEHDSTNASLQCFINNAGEDMTAVCDKISAQESLQDACETCENEPLLESESARSGDFIPVQASTVEFESSTSVLVIGTETPTARQIDITCTGT